MTWHDTCNDFNSRIAASANDSNFNDTVFLLTKSDADNPDGDEVSANKAILSLISPVFYAQFYGPLATRNKGPIEIVDGTARSFKRLLSFICNPNSFEIKIIEIVNVAELFDLAYFAHKYQIRSLVSYCRQFLGGYNVYGEELDILNWSMSSEHGLEMKEAFPAEHALLVSINCYVCIGGDFETAFPGGQIEEGQELTYEDVLIKILQNTVRVDQEVLFSVAIDFYCKMMEKTLKVDGQNENEWDEKIDKIKSVVQFDKFHPGKLSGIYEKFLDKIPDKVMCKITKEVSACWKNKDKFNFRQINGDKEPGATFLLAADNYYDSADCPLTGLHSS